MMCKTSQHHTGVGEYPKLCTVIEYDSESALDMYRYLPSNAMTMSMLYICNKTNFWIRDLMGVHLHNLISYSEWPHWFELSF